MFSERLKLLKPYTPGEQPQDKKYIKLNTNENPYPPTPKIKKFLKDFNIDRLRRYPDPLSVKLRSAMAKHKGLKSENVFISNSSDEVLSFAFYAFFDSSIGKLLFPEFTYSFYPVYCNYYNIAFRRIPLTGEYNINIDDYIQDTDSCGLIIPNPNAPTGICLPITAVKSLLEQYPKDKVVIIDEAYIDFGGESAVTLINDYNNLLVIQTFSKGLSLAALRVGYALGASELIKALFTVKDSFNSYPVDLLAQNIGEIAIRDKEYYRKINQKIIDDRERFSRDLSDMGWTVLPSKANFIFTRKEKIQGKQIYLKLKERGILVRYFDTNGIKDFVRITIGTRKEMSTVLKQIKELF